MGIAPRSHERESRVVERGSRKRVSRAFVPRAGLEWGCCNQIVVGAGGCGGLGDTRACGGGRLRIFYGEIKARAIDILS